MATGKKEKSLTNTAILNNSDYMYNGQLHESQSNPEKCQYSKYKRTLPPKVLQKYCIPIIPHTYISLFIKIKNFSSARILWKCIYYFFIIIYYYYYHHYFWPFWSTIWASKPRILNLSKAYFQEKTVFLNTLLIYSFEFSKPTKYERIKVTTQWLYLTITYY